MHIIPDRLKRNLAAGSFTRGVLTLTTGTTIAQVIPFLVAPILSRIYKPEDFGGLALYLSLASLLSVIATAQYANAVTLPEKDEEAIQVAGLAILFSLGISGVVLLIVSGCNAPLTLLLKHPEISIWLYLIPGTTFLTGLSQTLNYWFNRHRYYADLAKGRVVQSIFTAAANVIAGFSGFGVAGLILSSFIGQGIATGYLVWQFWGRDRTLMRRIRPDQMVVILRKYQDFPKFSGPQIFLDNLRNSSVILLISSYFNPAILGYYSFTLKIIQTPLSFIGASVFQVFYQTIAEAYHSKQAIWPLGKKLLSHLTLISLPPLLILLMAAPPLFPLFFGPEWTAAGSYAQILAPWLLIGFIASPLSTIPIVLRQQKAFFFVGLTNNLLLPASVLISSQITHNISIVLWAISLIGSLYLIAALIWIRTISIKSDQLQTHGYGANA
ncbi:hypothetical protein BST81_15775 [Leptolyngbya sp. 'hensonii']|uniref:lipopolysaccharide biosynthesis protein n=1 Tax=Leptolyngbya sp. 'hensonii' TaxID=1922337 RepID=UPI00094FD8E5|nr:oligosaccharide flippase family protein [Leptolyngbya sp. 'hensonii']OLP17276.1 hypothetical protein BST81_15775 [Leptolyngbya sp. 'hensonii']